MTFSTRPIRFNVEDNTEILDCRCPHCQRRYNGSDASGGHCTICHWSFRSMSTGDAHRVGPFEPPGQRRCLTPEEMTAKGWTCDEHGTWRAAPAENPHWKMT